MAILDTYVSPITLTSYVRTLPYPSNFFLNQFLPDQNVSDIKARIREVEQFNRQARFRSWDAETQITRRDGFAESEVGLPPIGHKLVLGEWERIQIERLRNGGSNVAPIVDAIYSDAEIIAAQIHTRMEVARGQLLSTGKVNLYSDGLNLEYDAGVPAGNFNVVGTAWSDTAASDPVADIRATVAEQVALTGSRPAFMIMSDTVWGYLLTNAKVRVLAGSQAGVPGIVTDATLKAVLASFSLPQPVIYSAKYRKHDETDADILPADLVIFVPDNPVRNLGRTAWGTTAHGLMLAGSGKIKFNQAPGLVGVVEDSADALRLYTSVHAVGLPLLDQPKKLMVLDVLP